MSSDGDILGVASEGRISSAVPAADALMACGPTTTEFDHIKIAAAMTAIAPMEYMIFRIRNPPMLEVNSLSSTGLSKAKGW